jgi:hypothetical protein
MRWRKITGIGLVTGIAIIQFFQPARNRSTDTSRSDLIKTISPPGSVQQILRNACRDCHSNHTNYPWYSVIQPFGWLLDRHIRNGKAELNFSEFGSYSVRRQISKLNGIKNSVRDGSMPLLSYKLLHKNARLSAAEKTILMEWAERIKDSLSLNK